MSLRAGIGAASLEAVPAAVIAESAKTLHGEWVVSDRGGPVDQLAEYPIVASARHAQAVADRSLFGASEAPPAPFEIENRTLARRQLHRATSMAAAPLESADIARTSERAEMLAMKRASAAQVPCAAATDQKYGAERPRRRYQRRSERPEIRSRVSDSNRRHLLYKRSALPAELTRRVHQATGRGVVRSRSTQPRPRPTRSAILAAHASVCARPRRTDHA